MSAVANGYAMAYTAEGWVMQAACVFAGCAFPGLIALATYMLAGAIHT